MCDDQEAVDLVRNIQDPVAAAKLLVDHALSCFSTDNLSCMIVRFDKDALLQSQGSSDATADATANTSAKVSEADKIVQDTKEKIASGSTPAVGVSASNSGRGHDPIALEEGNFVPTALSGSVTEEPAVVDDSPEVTPSTEQPPSKPN